MTAQIATVQTIDHLDEPRATQAVNLGAGARLIHTTVGQMDNNCWFLASPSGDLLLIDAASDSEHLLAVAEAVGGKVTDVLTTHQHADHVQALEEVLAATGARHHAPRKDADALPADSDEIYGNDEGTPEPLRLAGDFGTLDLHVVELRGHTPGGIAVLATAPEVFSPARAFVGDSLFPGGVGKTNTEEDFAQLLDDVNSRILSLPEDTAVHPGHGDSTTVGAERPKVGEWRERGW